MTEFPSNSLTIEESVKFLKRYGCNPNPQANSSEDYPLLRQALLLILTLPMPKGEGILGSPSLHNPAGSLQLS